MNYYSDFVIFQSDYSIQFPDNIDTKKTKEFLEETFEMRKYDAMNETVLQEVKRCPPLRFPDYVSIVCRIQYEHN